MAKAERLARMIDQGAGREPADLVIKNARLLDVITGELCETDIAICGDRIVGTHALYRGVREIDAIGLTAVPGFIDAHLHIESSLITPFEFDRCVLAHGVTTAICDPHEIANVLGIAGIRYFLDCALRTVIDLRVQLSSCVPATDFETSGARLELDDLLVFADHPKVIGLAEFMNFPGVLAKDPGCLAKLDAFQDRHVDGHCPLLSGKDLNAYIAAGIRTEHEATSVAEAREKLAKGMTVLIREGSVSKDLDALIPILDANSSAFVAFCTDDRNPLDIAREGHLDSMIARAIASGCPLHHVYRAASWSAANAFGLRDRGLIAPGRRADIVLLDDLETCRVKQVIAGGLPVSDAVFESREPVPPVGAGSVKLGRLTASELMVPAKPGLVPVIGVVAGRIITEHLEADLPVRGSERVCDVAQDIIKVAVVERHGRRGTIGRGFVKGFGLKRGAIASSVGHDSHNIIAVGSDDEAMVAAITRLVELGGGFVVADRDRVRAELALPLAGLMSDRPFEEVRLALEVLHREAVALGCVLPEPFLQVAFLALPVIPHLKITDLGMVDVDRFALI